MTGNMLYMPSIYHRPNMGDSSDEDDRDETCSVMSAELLDPADANINPDTYVQCPNVTDENPPPVVVSSKCWMCTFCSNPQAVMMHSFIIDNVSRMDVASIASQIKHQVLLAYPHALVSLIFTLLYTIIDNCEITR
jgi:hypothetical protein